MKTYLLLFLFLLSTLNDAFGGGGLFIIGGGKRPDSMMKQLIDESGILKGGFGFILPQASSEPDSSAYYAIKSFTQLGVDNLVPAYFTHGDSLRPSLLDSIRQAKLLYISGGDQNRFMKMVEGTAVKEAIRQCYQNGGMIAGTSAGAAVMSEKMITGNEKRYPENPDDSFRTIQSENIELSMGLGFLKTAVIDQHFVKRKRMNRLISVVLENPGLLGIGIDESTAILVKDQMAKVYGDSQVILLRLSDQEKTERNTLLGGYQLTMSVLLPGDTFPLEQE